MTDQEAQPAARVLRLLTSRGQTLAVAESLTGGLLAATLVAVPGASRVFRGGLVVYATDLKARLAGVDETLLAQRGAVDQEVARQLAVGARGACLADWGVATTGVAGPDPQDGQPVGTVWIAVSGPGATVPEATVPEATIARELLLTGNREQVRVQTVREAIILLTERLSWRHSQNLVPQGSELLNELGFGKCS
jgi:nicotinamide-nucleotide amidase